MNLKRILATTWVMIAACPVFAEPYGVEDSCKECNPSRPILEWFDPSNGWSAHIDWVLWKVRRSGLDYAIKGQSGSVVNGSIRSVDPGYDSGFRAGMFKDCGDCLRMGIRYANFETDAHQSSSTSSPNANFQATRVSGETADRVLGNLQSAKARYHIDADIIDLESSFAYNLDCACVTVRPFTGFRFSFIDQDLDSKYTGFDIQSGSGTITVNVADVITVDAYGLSLGLDAEWENIWCGIGLYGRFGSILNFCEFETLHLEKSTTSVFCDVKKHEYRIVPEWEIQVGLDYRLPNFLCACWDLRFGYEFHSWCNMPDYLNLPDYPAEGLLTRGSSDLSFDGLFLRLNAIF